MEEGGLRDQFRLQNIKLTWEDQDSFASAQWRWPRPVFVVYRLVAASYVIGWNIYGYVTIPTFGNHVTIVFYTNWSYLVLGLHLTLALLITLFHSMRRKEIRGASNQHPCGNGLTNGTHVITTCSRGRLTPNGGAGTISTAANQPSQECPQTQAIAKRKQGALKYNNNEYKADDNHRKRHAQEVTAGQCNGVACGKRRSKVRDHPEHLKAGEADAQGQAPKPRSIGVLCAGISANQTSSEGVQKRVINEGRGRARHGEANGVDDNPGRHAHSAPVRKSSTEVSPASRAGHKPQGQPGVGGESLYCALHVDAPRDGGQRSGERKQRRRRHVKVCHRGGRAVAFKYKSSNSSLDKIRSKGRRLNSGGRRKGSRSPLGLYATATAAAAVAHDSSFSGRDGGRKRLSVTLRGSSTQDENEIVDVPIEMEWTEGKHRKHRKNTSRTRNHEALEHQREKRRSKPRVCSTALPFTPEEFEYRGKKHRKHTVIVRGEQETQQQRAGHVSHHIHAKDNPNVSHSRENPSRVARPKSKVRNSYIRSDDTDQNSTPNVKATRSIGTNTSVIGAPVINRLSCTKTESLSRSSNVRTDLPFCSKVSWVVFNIAVVSAPVVSAVYFFILFPMLKTMEPNYRPGVLDINLHGVNSLIVLVEISISAIPVRILHFVYPVAYGITYVLFSIAYWALDKDNNILYPVILDWNNPGIATAIVGGIVFIATPLFQSFIYALYRLRIFIYKKIYKEDISARSGTQSRETEV